MARVVLGRWEAETMRFHLDKAFGKDDVKAWQGSGPDSLSIFRKLALNEALPVRLMSKRTSVATIFEAFNFNTGYLMPPLREPLGGWPLRGRRGGRRAEQDSCR